MNNPPPTGNFHKITINYNHKNFFFTCFCALNKRKDIDYYDLNGTIQPKELIAQAQINRKCAMDQNSEQTRIKNASIQEINKYCDRSQRAYINCISFKCVNWNSNSLCKLIIQYNMKNAYLQNKVLTPNANHVKAYTGKGVKFIINLNSSQSLKQTCLRFYGKRQIGVPILRIVLMSFLQFYL